MRSCTCSRIFESTRNGGARPGSMRFRQPFASTDGVVSPREASFRARDRLCTGRWRAGWSFRSRRRGSRALGGGVRGSFAWTKRQGGDELVCVDEVRTCVAFVAVSLAFVAVSLAFVAVSLAFVAVSLAFVAVSLAFVAVSLAFVAVSLAFVAVSLAFVAVSLSAAGGRSGTARGGAVCATLSGRPINKLSTLIQSWVPRVGCRALSAARWVPRVGCRALGAARWVPRWVPRVGCRALGAARWVPRVECRALSAARWVPRVGCRALGAACWVPRVECRALRCRASGR